MATDYILSCPVCGKEYGVRKGYLFREDIHKRLPKERQPNTPVTCPKCKHKMAVDSEEFDKAIITIINVD